MKDDDMLDPRRSRLAVRQQKAQLVNEYEASRSSKPFKHLYPPSIVRLEYEDALD
jgi:hypothetical protein